MNITSILKLATAFVAFSISAHAAEVFRVATVSTTYPVTTAANFAGGEYDIYGTTDAGNGSGVTVIDNFNGASSAVNTGDQITTGVNATTYFGPKFYAGVNRSVYQTQGGVMHSNGNGYRVRSNNISAALIGTAQVGVEGDPDYAAATGNGGEPINTKVIFMFDADTSSLSGEGDNLIFGDSDTLTAKLSVPGTLGPNWTGSSPSRASLATYRAVVKAKGPNDVTAQYYAGTLYSVDLANTPATSTQYNMSETGADATWTLMPNIEDDSTGGQVFGDTNLTVDTSDSATTISGKFLTNITQVGFLLETDTNENTGGYNYGVREFIANASPASEPHPIEWSQDFTSPVNGTGTFLTYANFKLYDGAVDAANLLTGFDHAYKWGMNGDGLTATPVPSTITQENNQIVLDVKSQGPDGEVNIRMVGPGTDNARRVRPPSHEVTFEIDLIEWKAGQADLLLQTRGHDGYIRSVLSPSGNVKYSTWGSDYTHTNFDNFSGPSSLRNNANNPGIVIVDGGTVDPTAAGVTVDISGNAEGTVVLNTAGDAVESVTITNYGSGYTALPTLTWTGMSVDPAVSFNFSTGNISRGNVVLTSLRDMDGNGAHGDPGDLPGSLLDDGGVLTYIQSYDNSDDSVSFYYSLDGGTTTQFVTKLTAADHSPGGHGFFDISTGNKWGQPNNQDAIWIQYKKWGTGTNEAGDLLPAKLAINSVTVATSDDDRDGIANRVDAFPNDPFESADADSDGVGDNSDAHAGYDDVAVAAINTAAQSAGDSTFSYYVTGNADDYSYSVGGGAITQEAYDAAVAAQAAAEAALAAAPTLAAVEQTVMDARAGSTRIDVSGGVASITLTLEETSDLGDWSSPTTTDHNIQLSAPAGSNFYRFKIAD